MSRIFDALQRSERERTGTDSRSLPEGPEFLQRAERQVAAEWKDVESLNSSLIAKTNGNHSVHESAVAVDDTPAISESPSLEAMSAEEKRRQLGQFKTLPIALSDQSRLVCLTDRESPTAEALRLLTVRLRDLRRIKPLKKVLITSTIPQEGKSTIAGNLACALSHATDERVLLVEGDLRRPSLSPMFGIRTGAGITECLMSEDGPSQGIFRLEGAGIWIMPAGRVPGNPLELLQSPKLPVLMNQLAIQFDWIIIDSPPVLPLADTSVWMRLAEGILLVTRQGTTEKRQLRKGLEALDPTKMLGALMNGGVASAYSGYYYRTTSQT
jgi:capsular exopolysaccharide synthesis family protein